MSVTLSPLPAAQATETQTDVLSAILLAINMLNRGGNTIAETDTLLAMDLIKAGEELDSALTP